jgi:hypothetical protein
MSLPLIQRRFGVPAVRGAAVAFNDNGRSVTAVIRGAVGDRLRVRVPGELSNRTLHPADNVRYLGAADRFQSLKRLYETSNTIPIRRDADEECSVFPDGSAIAICSNWAQYVRRIEGQRAELFGFYSHAVPESLIARLCFGHDFAVVDGRYLVDGWVKDIECLSAFAVFDLDDPATADEILRLYGPRAKWPRNLGLEAAVDDEAPEVRQEALRGVKLWRRYYHAKPSDWDSYHHEVLR